MVSVSSASISVFSSTSVGLFNFSVLRDLRFSDRRNWSGSSPIRWDSIVATRSAHRSYTIHASITNRLCRSIRVAVYDFPFFFDD